MLAVPNQGHVDYEIVSETLEDNQYMNIYPSQGITLDGSQRPFQYNSQYYTTGNTGEKKLQPKICSWRTGYTQRLQSS